MRTICAYLLSRMDSIIDTRRWGDCFPILDIPTLCVIIRYYHIFETCPISLTNKLSLSILHHQNESCGPRMDLVQTGNFTPIIAQQVCTGFFMMLFFTVKLVVKFQILCDFAYEFRITLWWAITRYAATSVSHKFWFKVEIRDIIVTGRRWQVDSGRW